LVTAGTATDAIITLFQARHPSTGSARKKRNKKMGYDIASDDGDGIVAVTTNTPVTYEIAHRFAESALEEARAKGYHRILVDLRYTRNEDSAVNQYLFVQELPKIGLTKSYSVAVIVGKTDNSHEFVASLIQNRGLVLRLFRDPAEAHSWLVQQPV